MNNRKAMSQTLTLIVTASVLMMTALTVGVLGRSSLTSMISGSQEDACVQSVRTACSQALAASSGSSATAALPAACDGLKNPGKVAARAPNAQGLSGTNGIKCTSG